MEDLTPDLCDNYPDLVQVVDSWMPVGRFSNFGGRSVFWGEIVTIKCYEDNSRIKDLSATAGKGRIIVVDGGGSSRRALLGDMIATTAMDNGWEGFVIFGCIRDVDVISQLNLGVQALGSVPLKTQRQGVGEVNIPVSFGGVTFKPGEYIYADNNGILVSPAKLTIPGED